MNNEQIKKEFEACSLGSFDLATSSSVYGSFYIDKQTESAWLGFQAAAQSRDELIGKLVEALKRINIEIEDTVDRYNGTPLQRLQLVKKISYHALQTLPEDLR